MCLLIAIPNPNSETALMVAHNRDEFVSRSFTECKISTHGKSTLCYGVDTKSGGTWLAARNDGLVSAVLNIRTFPASTSNTASRGILPILAATSDTHPTIENGSAYGPYNLIRISPQLKYSISSNQHGVLIDSEMDAPFAISNNNLADSTWEKTKRAKMQSMELLGLPQKDLISKAFDILSNKDTTDFSLLPQTGYPSEIEKALSANFVNLDKYQTVVSTVILILKDGRTVFVERNHLTGNERLQVLNG